MNNRMPDSNLSGQLPSARPSYSTSASGQPQGAERRQYRAQANQCTAAEINQSTEEQSTKTYEHLPVLDAGLPLEHSYGDPLQNSTRSKVVELLARQIEISEDLKYPLSVLIMEFSSQAKQDRTITEELQRSAASIFLSTLRATDLVLRYNERTLLAVLPEADEQGVAIASIRLKDEIQRQMIPEGDLNGLVPIFGAAGKLAGYPCRSNDLLQSAEMALERSRRYQYEQKSRT